MEDEFTEISIPTQRELQDFLGAIGVSPALASEVAYAPAGTDEANGVSHAAAMACMIGHRSYAVVFASVEGRHAHAFRVAFEYYDSLRDQLGLGQTQCGMCIVSRLPSNGQEGRKAVALLTAREQEVFISVRTAEEDEAPAAHNQFLETDGEGPFKLTYRDLTEKELKAREAVVFIMNDAAQVLALIEAELGGSRELSLAKTKLQEAKMWAVTGITT